MDLGTPRERVVPAVLYAGQFLIPVGVCGGHFADRAPLVVLGHVGGFSSLSGVSLAVVGSLAEVRAGSLGLEHGVEA